MKALLCLIAPHRWGRWKLGTVTLPLGIVKDTAGRCCERCRCRQTEVIPFR